jgi:16S rRNA processing protein RimM
LVTTHGLKGWLKLKPHNPNTTFPLSARQVFLHRARTASPHTIQESRPFRRLWLLKLEGIDTINQAEEWVGAEVFLAREDLQPLQSGEYYCHQVMGFDVYDVQERWLGKINRLWAKPGGDLYVVEGSGKEHLIPVCKEIVDKVDLVRKRITINPPPGLLEL